MSKFDGLLNARKASLSATQKSTDLKTQRAETEPVRVGRPRAKRSDPQYQQVTAYIRRETYTAARKLLLDEQREFSELVEELVGEWVNRKGERG
jgi:hypothetical protein